MPAESRAQTLPRYPETPITRHAKVAGTRSPFDGDWAYWDRRLRQYAGISPLKGKLLNIQAGRCSWCGLYFTGIEPMEIHHLDEDRNNNRFQNLNLLHLHCHDAMHGTHDKSHRVEEPDEGNLSCPVLQRQEAG